MMSISRQTLYDYFKEMFERIDQEADGEVYVKEVTDFLRVLDDNLEQNEEVID